MWPNKMSKVMERKKRGSFSFRKMIASQKRQNIWERYFQTTIVVNPLYLSLKIKLNKRPGPYRMFFFKDRLFTVL